jgi:hypothetical protein
MSYKRVAETLNFQVSEHVIRHALEREGFFRRIAMRKPPISTKNQRARLQ